MMPTYDLGATSPVRRGRRLHPGDQIISVDAKPSVQARSFAILDRHPRQLPNQRWEAGLEIQMIWRRRGSTVLITATAAVSTGPASSRACHSGCVRSNQGQSNARLAITRA